MSSMQRDPLDYYQMCVNWSEEDEAFIASLPELPGCMADGATQSEALANLREVAALWIETAQQLGRNIPAPKYVPELSTHVAQQAGS